ncbi:MAG: TM1802 family CRISPR-associated protein, partial [Conexivisphaera sp.]
MFDSLLHIGELVKSEGRYQRVPSKNCEGLCLIVFDCVKREVYVERYDVTDSTNREWTWVGNFPKASHAPAIFATMSNPKYLLGFERKPTGSRHGGDGEAVEYELLRGYQFVLHNLSDRLGGKSVGSAISEVLKWYSPDEFVRRGDEIRGMDWKCCLYSTRIITSDGSVVDVAKDMDYRNFVFDHLSGATGELLRGVRCQFCGREGVLSKPQYPRSTLLKIFVVDKKGFSSGISDTPESWSRVHAVCPSCMEKLMAGNNYVMDRLRTNIGKLTVYVIPSLPDEVDLKDLEHISVKEEGKGWLVGGLKAIENAERGVEESAPDWEYLVQLTLVFGRSAQSRSNFDVQMVVPDVGVPRIVEVVRTAKAIAGRMGIDALRVGPVDLGSLYALMPVRETRNGVDAGPFLEAVEALLLGYTIDRRLLIHRILQQLRCIKYGTCENSYASSMFIENKGKEVPYGLERASMLAAVFIRLLTVENPMGNPQPSDGALEDPVKYAESLGLPKALSGVFLLGVLTAYV